MSRVCEHVPHTLAHASYTCLQEQEEPVEQINILSTGSTCQTALPFNSPYQDALPSIHMRDRGRRGRSPHEGPGEAGAACQKAYVLSTQYRTYAPQSN